MNRSLGLTTGTVLLLGVILRTGTGAAPTSMRETPPAGLRAESRTAPAATRAAEVIDKAGKKLTGEGPWIASCKYWETSTGLEYPKDAGNPTQVAPGFKNGNNRIEPKGNSSAGESASECERNGDAWGIPASTSRVTPDITAIIAGVSDPLHTHLALEFDRDIDSILQAGAENDYLVSQYWLPWTPAQSPEQNSPTEETDIRSETGHQHTREQQPGLIVLKYAPDNNDWRSYDRVIYLFLVGESPASGMNGTQLRNALRYEAMLKSRSPSTKVNLVHARRRRPCNHRLTQLRCRRLVARGDRGRQGHPPCDQRACGWAQPRPIRPTRHFSAPFRTAVPRCSTSHSAKTLTTRNTRRSICSGTPATSTTGSPCWLKMARSSATPQSRPQKTRTPKISLR